MIPFEVLYLILIVIYKLAFPINATHLNCIEIIHLLRWQLTSMLLAWIACDLCPKVFNEFFNY